MAQEHHTITIVPGMKCGYPCIDGIRMTVAQVANMWWDGSTLEELGSWDFLTRGSVVVCCWYQARYGSRTWRKRWKVWLQIADRELWDGHYDCPMPSQKQSLPTKDVVIHFPKEKSIGG